MHTKVELMFEASNKLKSNNKSNTNIYNQNNTNEGRTDNKNYIDKKKFAEFTEEYEGEKQNINTKMEDMKKSLLDLINSITTKNNGTDDAFKKIEGSYIKLFLLLY